MGHLTNDEFFAKLLELFESKKGANHGTVLLTQKRLSYGEPTPESTDATVLADLHPPRPLPILIRATNAKGKADRKDNKKIKLSTVVQPDDLPGFYEKYAEICKTGMTALKPRDRSKRKGKARRKNKTATTAPTAA